ncbi:hypothetical protein CHH28_10575 [Bacterioplanes sanyensis]|uniref:FAD-binding domain-containing protein n=1 Tax=Bacterioplanes sanyensis TaxID=1249553 RepID=A0A222FJ80_9GAMM|nr:tryptophan 7-halogenase [Bacterioplanes sanyensis]ASP39095.1 hypothetical protein CHH28_10575 [Bacterioplanes sanyensis]
MDQIAHITILGAGPAGLATALSLANQAGLAGSALDIHVIDAATDIKVKVGETIPPAATSVLRDLIGDHTPTLLSEHNVCPGSVSLWGNDRPGHNDFMFNLEGHGYHLDRIRFEEQLTNIALTRHISLQTGERLKHLESLGAGFSLHLSKDGQSRRIETDFLVDAAGRSAITAQKLGTARNSFDEVTFICSVLECDQLSLSCNDLPTRTLVESCDYGWWYCAQLPNEKVILMLCTDKKQMLAQCLHQADVWLERVRETQLLAAELHMVLKNLSSKSVRLFKRNAKSSILSAVIAPNWLAVGDAACSYDPISSAGITKALMHGQLAGNCIYDYLSGNNNQALTDYQNQVFDDFNKYAALRQSLYASEQRFANSGYWQRRQGFA